MNVQVADMKLAELPASALRRRCDPAQFTFENTAGLTALGFPAGQERALNALTFGIAMEGKGFNMFVSGAAGSGRTIAVRDLLTTAARSRPAADDWCYVHNRLDPTRPRVLRLPAGDGRRLQERLRALVIEARRKIPRAFETDEYTAQREKIMEAFNRGRDQGMQELAAHAERAGFLLQPTPTGFSLIPTMGNRPLTEDDVAGLRTEMREVIERGRADLESEVQSFMKRMISAERSTREHLEAQDREVALHAVSEVVDAMLDEYEGQSEVLGFLQDIREEILGDIGLLRSHPLGLDASLPEPPRDASAEHAMHERALRKYEVNLIVDNGGTAGAPVVFEPNPTYPNLVGRIEREAIFGALMTDPTLIGAGALHRANGGYLVLRLADIARSPLSWEALKRSLREESVVIEDAGEVLGLGSARGLRPEPVPLKLKVVLIGEPAQFQMLNALDPDFAVHFKIRADFDSAVERTPENEQAYAALMGTAAAREGYALNREAAALLIEESSRLASDQERLSSRLGPLTDLASEAAQFARMGGTTVVSRSHVQQAIDGRACRASLVPERLREFIKRGILLVRPEGMATGQIHGLAVMEAGGLAFGVPSRITATISAGREGVIDIERLVEMGGPIHSKGVLILAGYLGDVYAQDKPLPLSARLVFEQSYEGIEGDSASLAELVLLLSRIAGLPIRQDIAVTGSVNQHGEVQAVGGVNEKIEGFFDVCAAVGLTGTQGALLPASNASNLMLRPDVVEAVQQGRFHVFSARTVDEALRLLTGVPAGLRNSDGTWPEGTVHARVASRLRSLSEVQESFAGPEAPKTRRGARSNPKAARSIRNGRTRRLH